MNRIPNIKLEWDEYQKIISCQRYSAGFESIICKTGEQNSLYKFFCDSFKKNFPYMSNNKLQKVSKLYEMQLPYSVQPLATVTAGNYLVGYKMTYDSNNISLSRANLPRRETIDVLKRTKTILEYFATRDITYGDIREDNILFNTVTGEILFCDMDNIRLGEYPIDLKLLCLADFVKKYGKVDEKTDAYIHNLLTLQLLNSHWVLPPIEWVDEKLRIDFFSSDFERPAISILESMVDQKNFTGEYIVQYVKK